MHVMLPTSHQLLEFHPLDPQSIRSMPRHQHGYGGDNLHVPSGVCGCSRNERRTVDDGRNVNNKGSVRRGKIQQVYEYSYCRFKIGHFRKFPVARFSQCSGLDG